MKYPKARRKLLPSLLCSCYERVSSLSTAALSTAYRNGAPSLGHTYLEGAAPTLMPSTRLQQEAMALPQHMLSSDAAGWAQVAAIGSLTAPQPSGMMHPRQQHTHLCRMRECRKWLCTASVHSHEGKGAKAEATRMGQAGVDSSSVNVWQPGQCPIKLDHSAVSQNELIFLLCLLPVTAPRLF